MKVIYVAGPFRGPNHWVIEENIRRAERIAWEVWANGDAAVCPHANTRFYQGSLPDATWLNGDIEILKRCDGVVLCPGWRDSSGTRAEVAVAIDNNIPVYDGVADYLHGRELEEPHDEAV